MKPVRMLASILLAWFAASWLPAQEPLHLVRHGGDIALRDRLIDARALVADLGPRCVARLSVSLARQCAASGAVLWSLPEPAAGQRYAALYAREGAPDPRGFQVLVDDGDLLLVAGDDAALQASRQPGVFGGGVQVLDLEAPYAPTVFLAPAGVDVPDPRIQSLVSQVATTNLNLHIAALSAIPTRRADQAQNAQAVTYLQAQLAAIPGLTVVVQNFRAGYGPNVIAELPGRERPDEIVIVGAHFDSYAGSGQARAPGADDNASGSASVLELARLLATLPLRRTVRLCWWNAEEFGLYGSAAYAQTLRNANANVIAYLNTDMNAYRAAGDARDLDFITNNSTASLIQYLTTVSQTYVPSLPVVTGSLSGGSSDHASFFSRGFPAVFYFEDASAYSPYIHTANDTQALSTNDMTLATMITQSVLAGVAELAQPLEPPAFTLNIGSGPTIGGTAVLASGVDLQSVVAVRVASVPVGFTSGAAGISFATPIVASAGVVDVELDNGAGTGRASFTCVPTAPPALRLPATLSIPGSCTVAIGGPPGHLAITLLSLVPGPTVLPPGGLGIGGGDVGNIATFDLGALSPHGGTHTFPLAIPDNPALTGLVVHFQAVTLDAALQGLALTNVATSTLQ